MHAPVPAPTTSSNLGPLPAPTATVPPQAVPADDSGNVTQVPDYGQCGGAGATCPLGNRTLCEDAPYLPCANATSACTRQNKWYWQVSVLQLLPAFRMRHLVLCTHSRCPTKPCMLSHVHAGLSGSVPAVDVFLICMHVSSACSACRAATPPPRQRRTAAACSQPLTTLPAAPLPLALLTGCPSDRRRAAPTASAAAQGPPAR
jgi:hypothetical protein